MKRIIKFISVMMLVIFLALFTTELKSQIVVDNYTSSSDAVVANALVDTLMGSGISFSNPSFLGVRNSGGSYGYQLCYFTTTTTTASTMQISRGIALTSGNTNLISLGMATNPGASNSFSKGYNSSTPGELRKSTAGLNDMNVLAGAVNWFNGAVLEFDFVPSGDSVVFRYVFGGEEYSDNTNFTNYQCSQYNDKFGFLISGLGISGGAGYDDDAYNMARLNNGSEVGINSVNNGTVGSSGSPNGPSYCENVNPDWNEGTPSPEFLGTIPGTALNGNTIPLYAAKGGLTPGETYHIKLLICDATDGAYDAIVYIEAGSFSSPSPTLSVVANPQEICDGESTWIVATTTDLVAPITYAWSNGTTNVSNNPADSIQVSPSADITYTVTVTDDASAVYIESVDVTVNAITTPTFPTFGPYCEGETADLLPANSSNGITGTWSPATISTSTSGNITYNFTSTAGQCANNYSQSVTVNPVTTPTFDAFGPYCQNEIPDVLPLSSNNAIDGTWSPAIISTTTAGDATYTFTPDGSVCSEEFSVVITVSPSVNPVFNSYGPYCTGATADLLPSTSNNSVDGTWSPATINTSSAAITTYTFTPDLGQCASSYTTDIEIAESFVPEFNVFGPYCLNESPELLPATSNNSITGLWSPAAITTTTEGTVTYTFTPDAGQCAEEITIDVITNFNIMPEFANFGPYCEGIVADILPTQSQNTINGTWNPAIIDTDLIGNTSYTFTPTTGQCALIFTTEIVVNELTIPTFNSYGPYCQGVNADILPITSLNGVDGSWLPIAINSLVYGTVTYTFTPSAGFCASNYSTDITVNETLIPVLDAIGPYCVNDIASLLPSTSSNGLDGVWNPLSINTLTSGVTTFTFTPTGLECYNTNSIEISIYDYPDTEIAITDSILFSGEETAINVSGADSYDWFNSQFTICDACTNAVFTAPSTQINDETFEIILTSTSNGCSVVDTIKITVLGDIDLEIPEGFSPNGDGNADVWEIKGLDRLYNNEVVIHNRWGNVVYSAKPYNNEWRGENKNGEMLPAGTYYYVFKPDSAVSEVYSGYVYINY